MRKAVDSNRVLECCVSKHASHNLLLYDNLNGKPLKNSIYVPAGTWDDPEGRVHIQAGSQKFVSSENISTINVQGFVCTWSGRPTLL